MFGEGFIPEYDPLEDPGVIAAIVISGVVFLAIVGGTIAFFVRRRREIKKYSFKTQMDEIPPKSEPESRRDSH
jgi:hypothetical protein